MDKTNLNSDRLSFINAHSRGALFFGPATYFGVNNIAKEFYSSMIPVYSTLRMWPLAVRRGRRIVWERGSWDNFESYKKYQLQIDKAGKIFALGGLLGIVWAVGQLYTQATHTSLGVIWTGLLVCAGIFGILGRLLLFRIK